MRPCCSAADEGRKHGTGSASPTVLRTGELCCTCVPVMNSLRGKKAAPVRSRVLQLLHDEVGLDESFKFVKHT